jgi:predicted secreted protein
MRTAVIALLTLFAAPQAWASDAAESVLLGYSPDGRYFAFEQFGTQDGSGFPYSEIFVLDLDRNSWVEGTPIRVLIENEEATAGAARARSAAAAGPMLTRLKVSEPAVVLASSPATEVRDDRNSLAFDRYYRHMGGSVPMPASETWARRYEMKVSTTDLAPVPEHCQDYGEPVKALTVTLTELNSGKTTTVHQDSGVPQSRGCPQGYDIDKIVAPAAYGEDSRFVALIGVYTYGFEGQDRRYIAVPARPQ